MGNINGKKVLQVVRTVEAGGGSTPIHNITMKSIRSDVISFCIPYEKDTAMTFSEVRDYLKSKFSGIVDGNSCFFLDKYLVASGEIHRNNNAYQAIGIYYYSREGYGDGLGIIIDTRMAFKVSNSDTFWNVVNDVIL